MFKNLIKKMTSKREKTPIHLINPNNENISQYEDPRFRPEDTQGESKERYTINIHNAPGDSPAINFKSYSLTYGIDQYGKIVSMKTWGKSETDRPPYQEIGDDVDDEMLYGWATCNGLTMSSRHFHRLKFYDNHTHDEAFTVVISYDANVLIKCYNHKNINLPFREGQILNPVDLFKWIKRDAKMPDVDQFLHLANIPNQVHCWIRKRTDMTSIPMMTVCLAENGLIYEVAEHKEIKNFPFKEGEISSRIQVRRWAAAHSYELAHTYAFL